MEGGWGRLAERRGRRGPLLQGSRIPKVFATSTEELAIDRPSFCLAMVFFFPFLFFSFFFVLFGCMMSRCYFCLMYHVSCVFVNHDASVGACAFAGDIMHGVFGGFLRVRVCAYLYLLLGQCFVFIALLTL